MGVETFAGSNTVVIDLGLDRGEPDTYATPSRSTVPGWFRPVLVTVLVLLSSVASAAPLPPALSPLISLRVGPADTYSMTEERRLIAQTVGTVSAYDLDDGDLIWEVDQERPTYRMRTAGGLVLMRPWTYGPGQPVTTALSLATGVSQWKHPGMVMTITGSSALLAVTSVRSNSGSNRRVQGPIERVDARTGKPLWRIAVPSTAVMLGVPGPDGAPRLLVVHDDRTAAVHDLATGRKLAGTELPPANYGPENPTVTDGLLLLRHLGRWEPVVSAYDPVTLQLRWQRSAERAYEVRNCGAFACLVGPAGITAIRPSDGRLEWYQPSWRSIEQRGELLLAYGNSINVTDPIGIVDPANGRVLVDLTGWRLVGGSGGDHVLVTRAAAAGARTMVAVAGPGTAGLRPLAELPPGTGDCQAVPDRLACRSSSGELTVWAYRKKV
ncbi:outer membrane protein assembly factor BamB family protein [Jidongwangia harbinensis]|uniref:outer membrane protein assembly factor BamB family protein n=1 Tax=Jidongwangia harbinensis TaxID=2878561 RepID=UPI001CD92A6F|nr:PQQ-binding-like beta-propeller repeat protein [Jidongwangia harbinensis]MCA2216106.1 PQQ-binding-like beta-propeller repeat protein [Jidongwangia harbinensis]